MTYELNLKARGILGIVLCLVILQTHAQIKEDTLETVVISGQYWDGYEFSDNSTELSKDFVPNPAGNVGNAFLETSGHIFTSYGLSGLVAPRIRGTNPEHTAVLWNGINTNHAGLGQGNAFNIPLYAADRISLNSGGASSIFGTGAIGGVIQLLDRVRFDGKSSLILESGYGSFDRLHSQFQFTKNTSRFSSSFRFYRNQSNNDFKYTNTSDFRKPELKQVNAGFRQTGISGHIAYKFNKNSQLRFHSWIHDGHTEIQPAMTNQNSDNWQKDQTHRYKLSYHHFSNLGLFEVSTFYTSDAINFINEVSVIERVGAQLNWRKSILPFWSVSAGINNNYFVPDSPNYLHDASENRTSFFALNRFEFDALKLGFNFRYTMIDGYKVPLTPEMSLQYDLLNENNTFLMIYGNYSENFRVPTLNERFWIPNANPDILPELSREAELGIKAQRYGWEMKLSAYQMVIDNVVRWIENDSLWSEYNGRWYTGLFVPVNFNQLENRGVNFSVTTKPIQLGPLKVIQNVIVNHCHSLTLGNETKRKSWYVPENTLVSNSEILFPSAFKFNVNWHWIDENPTISNNLDAYSLLNLMLSRNTKMENHTLEIFLRVNNLLDSDYQTFINRAMPGRNYMISVRLNLNKYETD